MKLGIISGYFNPIHTGHLDYIDGAKDKCDFLFVIVNNDNQVGIKGSKRFMNQASRLRIVKALHKVNGAMVSIDQDSTVCESIKEVHRLFSEEDIYFMNGGDIGQGTVPEAKVCEELGIKMVYNVGGIKTESSSTLLQKVASE